MLTEKYLSINYEIWNMNAEFINEWYADTSNKIRCIESLISQTKKDYAELNQLWQKFDNKKIDEIEIDELFKKISWVKQELNIFIEFRNKDIEGVLWVDAEYIAKDLQVKENQIIKIIRPVSDETEYSHIR
jgi:chemotaxis regulatin CheY-phosphate phosphatase CheZ